MNAATFVGLTTLDLVHRVAGPVGPDEKVTAVQQDVAAGGPAANAAATFAALGGDATLITVLGSHPLAAAIMADLVARGVRVVDAAPDYSGTPPVSSVRVVETTGERSVSSINDAEVVHLNHLPQLRAFDALLVLDGWYRGLALPAADAARRSGIPVLLGAGSWRPLVADLLPSADTLITSASFPVDRIPDGMPYAQTSGASAVRYRPATGHLQTIEVQHGPARDTLGAGDVFLGAAACALAAGDPFPAALRRAATAASVRVQHIGIRAGIRAAAESLRGER